MPPELFLLLAEAQPLKALLDHKTRNASRTRLPRPHHDDIGVRAPATGDESLRTVDNIVVAIAHGPGCKGGSIRPSVRFGEAIGGEALHRAKVGQETFAERFTAVSVNHARRHVVDGQVGRGRRTCRRQRFDYDSAVQPTQRRTTDVLTDVNSAEAKGRRIPQGFLGEDMFGIPMRGVRRHLLGCEDTRNVLKRLLVVR